MSNAPAQLLPYAVRLLVEDINRDILNIQAQLKLLKEGAYDVLTGNSQLNAGDLEGAIDVLIPFVASVSAKLHEFDGSHSFEPYPILSEEPDAA